MAEPPEDTVLLQAPSEALVISEVTFSDEGQDTGIVVVVVVVVVVVEAVLLLAPPPEVELGVLMVEDVWGLIIIGVDVKDDAGFEDVGDIELTETTHFNFPDTF